MIRSRGGVSGERQPTCNRALHTWRFGDSRTPADHGPLTAARESVWVRRFTCGIQQGPSTGCQTPRVGHWGSQAECVPAPVVSIASSRRLSTIAFSACAWAGAGAVTGHWGAIVPVDVTDGTALGVARCPDPRPCNGTAWAQEHKARSRISEGRERRTHSGAMGCRDAAAEQEVRVDVPLDHGVLGIHEPAEEAPGITGCIMNLREIPRKSPRMGGSGPRTHEKGTKEPGNRRPYLYPRLPSTDHSDMNARAFNRGRRAGTVAAAGEGHGDVGQLEGIRAATCHECTALPRTARTCQPSNCPQYIPRWFGVAVPGVLRSFAGLHAGLHVLADPESRNRSHGYGWSRRWISPPSPPCATLNSAWLSYFCKCELWDC